MWFEEREAELICQPTNYLLIPDELFGRWMRRALKRQGGRVIDSRLVGQVIGVVERHFSDIGSLIAQIANTRS